MQKDKEPKVYKGIFISNQRRKRAGGRIKCPDFQNKIQVMGKNQAIHQSQVEWVQVRRYKKLDRNQKKSQNHSSHQNNQKSKENQVKPTIKENQVKNNKYKEKVESKKNQEKKVFKPIEQKGKQIQKEHKIQKKLKFKLKPDPNNVTNVSKNDKVDNQQTKQEQPVNVKHKEQTKLSNQKQTVNKQLQDPKNQKDREVDRKEQQNESASQSEEEEKKDLQIIVARIKRETNIIFKSRPFVGILNFQKKRAQPKKKEKDVKQPQISSPIQRILKDFFADIVPIHARLPVMQLDDLVDQNRQILEDYIFDDLKFNIDAPQKKQLNRILDSLCDIYILITFSDWNGEFPLCKIHKVIGKAMTIDGECQRFLYQHSLNDFSYKEPKESLQKIQLVPTELHKKIERVVFTIDPPTSTDLDDALSIESIGDNLFEVGIHIADVSSYLKFIDRDEIARRTTSVYLPYKVFHMLSANLVSVCSLDPGVERLAFTVWVVMDSDGNVIGDGRLQKNVIQSRYKLSYQVVQDMITGQLAYNQFNQKYPSTEVEYQGLLERLLNLTTIATAHRNKRIVFDVFENRQITFKMDENRWPIECFVQKRYTAKKVVEEFMIIGNIQSAKCLAKSYPQCALVIHHPKPTTLSVKMFNDSFKQLNTKFKFENVLDVQKQLMEVEQNDKIKNQVKQMCYFKARRTMEPAIYRLYSEAIQEQKNKNKQAKKQGSEEETIEPIVHFALGLQFYTHFTSPMRRMADILVHQSLTQLIQGQKPNTLLPEEIQKINAGRRSTKRLKKDLNEVYLCLMIYHTKKPIETEGIIASFGMDSVSIFIPLFDMQKQVMFKSQFNVHSVKRVPKKEDILDIKLYHDRKSAKGDIYWVISRYQKVWLTLGCTKYPPLRLTVQMKVQSQKGPYVIEWLQY